MKSEACANCGMRCQPREYHPYTACVLFRQLRDGDKVRSCLEAVVAHGRGPGWRKADFSMWIGVDPENGKPLPWSLSKTRSECRSAMDSMCWGAGRVRRVTLMIADKTVKQ